MNVRYRVDMEDTVAFNQYFIETLPYLRRQRILWTAIFSAIYICFGFIHAIIKGSIIPLLLWMCAAVGFGLWYYRASLKVSPKRVVRLYSGEKNKGSFCEHELVILPDGIRETTDVGEQLSSFSGIERIETTDTHAFIFIGTMQAHVIPRNKVLEGDLDVFISTLRSKIETAAKLAH